MQGDQILDNITNEIYQLHRYMQTYKFFEIDAQVNTWRVVITPQVI